MCIYKIVEVCWLENFSLALKLYPKRKKKLYLVRYLAKVAIILVSCSKINILADRYFLCVGHGHGNWGWGNSSHTRCLFPLAVNVCSSSGLSINSFHSSFMYALKGLFIDTSSGWRIGVHPAGTKIVVTFLIDWLSGALWLRAWSTSRREGRENIAPCLLEKTSLSHSEYSSEVIDPPFATLITIPKITDSSKHLVYHRVVKY